MSTFYDKDITCAVCGMTHSFTVIDSWFDFGSPGLDQRPTMMARGTMKYWVQRCPFCGYVAESISNPCPVDRRFLYSFAYRTCNFRFFFSSLAKRFYRQYLIAREAFNDDEAFNAVLHAAWACDDIHDRRNAKYCRNLATLQIRKLLHRDDIPDKNKEGLLLIMADLLRRSKRFSEVVLEYRRIRFSDAKMNEIRGFEIKMSRQKNAKFYTVEEALDYQKRERGKIENRD